MTPLKEWNDLIARTRNMICAAVSMVLSAFLLMVSMGILFCSVFTTFFRVILGKVDQTTAKIAVPESYNAELAASTSQRTTFNVNEMAMRERFKLFSIPMEGKEAGDPMPLRSGQAWRRPAFTGGAADWRRGVCHLIPRWTR